jgi:GATA zinc finger
MPTSPKSSKSPQRSRVSPLMSPSSSPNSSTDDNSPRPRVGSLGPPASADHNLFAELETLRSTSWQYELHQMRLTNKKLREEVESLQSKMYGTELETTPSGSASSDSSLGRICKRCKRRHSPEWRCGPGGPKELCNACGLRYAKSLAVKSD